MLRRTACLFALIASPALADFNVCNESAYDASVAIGYKDGENWTSEGWWNIGPGDCASPVKGDLKQRYYYVRVTSDDVDYPTEDYAFCTTPKVFTIVGDENCTARGYDKAFFVEVDTGEARDYTFPLYAEGGGDASGDDTPGDDGQQALEDDYQRLYAQVYGDLQGFWVDPDDDAIGLRIDDTRLTDYFAGAPGGSATWTVADTCTDADGAGPVLLVDYDDFDTAPLCWVILRLSYREAQFRAIGGGTFSLLKRE